MECTVTTVTVTTEPSRRVIRFALWRILANDVVGERALSDALYDRACGAIHPVYGLGVADGDAEFRLLRIATMTAAARTVDAAATGTAVELPVSPAEYLCALDDCLCALEDNDNLFWNLAPLDRGFVNRCREEAVLQLEAVGAQLPDGTHDGGLVATTEEPATPIAVPEYAEPVRVRRVLQPTV